MKNLIFDRFVKPRKAEKDVSFRETIARLILQVPEFISIVCIGINLTILFHSIKMNCAVKCLYHTLTTVLEC